MLQVQSKNGGNFALRQTFTPNGLAYVSLVRLPAHLRNPGPNDGTVVWSLRVDSNDTGGSVNASARIITALVEYVQTHGTDEIVHQRGLDLPRLREKTGHTGLLQFSEAPGYDCYSAQEWLGSVEE